MWSTGRRHYVNVQRPEWGSFVMASSHCPTQAFKVRRDQNYTPDLCQELTGSLSGSSCDSCCNPSQNQFIHTGRSPLAFMCHVELVWVWKNCTTNFRSWKSRKSVRGRPQLSIIKKFRIVAEFTVDHPPTPTFGQLIYLYFLPWWAHNEHSLCMNSDAYFKSNRLWSAHCSHCSHKIQVVVKYRNWPLINQTMHFS